MGSRARSLITPAPGRRQQPPAPQQLGHDARGAAVTLFVEVKRPGEKPRPSQVGMITTMRDHGAHVVVADSRTAVDEVLAEYFVRPSVPIAERDPHDAPLPGRRPHVLMALQP